MNFTLIQNPRQSTSMLLPLFVIVAALVVERVAGLPIIFLGMTIQSVELTDRGMRRVLLLAASIILAFMYQTSFLGVFILLVIGELTWFGLSYISSSKTSRILASVGCMLFLFVVTQHITVTGTMLVYMVFSTLVLITIVRTNQQFTMRK